MPINLDIHLRRAERDDIDTVVRWMEDEDFQRFLYGDPARSPRLVRDQIMAMLGRTAGTMMPGAVYLMIDSKKHGPVGFLGIQNISWRNRTCSIDLYIGKKELRAGLTAALSTYRAFEYCFDELNLNRLSAFIYAFNTASWRTFERAGAKRELSFSAHVGRDGKLHDVYGYGLLRPEFEALRARFAGVKGASLREMAEALAADAPTEAQT